MYKSVAVVALSVAVLGCATPQTTAAQKVECTTEQVEATGSRVETERVCRPAQ